MRAPGAHADALCSPRARLGTLTENARLSRSRSPRPEGRGRSCLKGARAARPLARESFHCVSLFSPGKVLRCDRFHKFLAARFQLKHVRVFLSPKRAGSSADFTPVLRTHGPSKSFPPPHGVKRTSVKYRQQFVLSWDTTVKSPLNCTQRTRSLLRSCRFAGRAGPSLCRNGRVSFRCASETWRLFSFFPFP